MLLAAGLGTRLRPLTELRPKPIVPVANRPLAGYAIEHLAGIGVRQIVANTHPMPELVEEELAASCPSGVSLSFSRETTLLGTALKMHVDRSAVATMLLRRTPDPERFGAVGIDAANRVTTLLGRPTGREVRELLMFTGVHILAPAAFEAMPESGCVIRSAYRDWVDKGSMVVGVIDDSPWADLGTVSEYHRLNVALASGNVRWPGVEPLGRNVLAQGVESDGRIRRSVIGRGARLDEGVELDACVVWPGSHVTQSSRNAVVTPRHRIILGE